MAILCQRCERRLRNPKLLRFWISPRSGWGKSRLGDLICARCGSVLPAEMVTERLLSKLSQLGQFGLDAAARPLLKPAGNDS
jgi:hypothetical protein